MYRNFCLILLLFPFLGIAQPTSVISPKGTMISTAITGDVTGSLGSAGTKVIQINGSPLGTTTGATNGQVLAWNGTAWALASATVPISSLTAAIANNPINNGDYPLTWNWNSSLTTNPLTIGASLLTTGKLFTLSNSSALHTGNTFLVSSNATAPSAGLVQFSFTGLHNGNGFQLDDATLTGTVANIKANGLTTGTALNIIADALTFGSALNITSASKSINSTNGLLNVANLSTSTNGTVAKIQSNSAIGSGLTVLASGNVGINNAAPANNLEINQGTSGNSGLRFTQLTPTSPGINPTNTSSQTLSVNSNGDVILNSGMSYVNNLPSIIIPTSYKLVAADNQTIIYANSSYPWTIFAPTDLPVGFTCAIIQGGSAQVTIYQGITGTKPINNAHSESKTAMPYASVTIQVVPTGTVGLTIPILSGDTSN